jgi:proton-translocating NADH-quinone oxidoreductase chain N
MNSTTLFWLIALPLALSPVIYFVGRLRFLVYKSAAEIQRTATNNPPGYWTGVIVLLLTWIPLTSAIGQFGAQGALTYKLGLIALRLDGLSLLVTVAALGLGTLVMLYSGPYLSGELGSGKYFTMLAMLVAVMMGLTCSTDLFNMWLWLEALSVLAYLLVAFYREQPASLEAGIKYLVQSAVGSVFILLGVALVLAQTSTLDLGQIRASAHAVPILIAAGGLFVVGFGVKVALAPMHTWLPDAHAQAPSGISAMLSGIVIEVALVALLRVLAALAAVTLSWSTILLIFAVINIAAGNLLALRQTQVKRLLAFSSLSHVGYMLLGLGIGVYSGQAAGLQGGLFHLLTHGMMKGLAFLAAGALLYALHVARGSHSPLTLTDLNGASKRYPVVALTLSIAVLALGGLPPLAGFMSKWQILVAGFQTQNLLIEALIVFAALNSVLSLGYYAPIVSALYRHEPSAAVQQGKPLSIGIYIPLVLLALLVVVLGFWPSLVNGLTEPAAQALLALIK